MESDKRKRRGVESPAKDGGSVSSYRLKIPFRLQIAFHWHTEEQS